MKMTALKKIDFAQSNIYTDEEFEIEDDRIAQILIERKLARYSTRELSEKDLFDRQLKASPKKRGRKPKNRAD